ncbi:hypothetical protein R6Q59_009488 [Mikania micrantha]
MTGLSWTAIKYAGGGRSGGHIIQEDYKERRIAGKFLMKMIKFDMFDNQKMLQQELKQIENLETEIRNKNSNKGKGLIFDIPCPPPPPEIILFDGQTPPPNFQ